MPTSKSKNKVVGITMGDPHGIGPEIIAKALKKRAVLSLANFVIIGDYQIFKRYHSSLAANCSFLDLNHCLDGSEKQSGSASLNYLKTAVNLLKRKQLTALVTAPVSKKSISLTQKSFKGHTEFLASAFKKKHVEMMFVTDELRTVIKTRHIPLNSVKDAINAQNIYQTICLTHAALKKTFRIKHPKIAVCGLNPHAGEGGLTGTEERTKIIPAVKKAQRARMKVDGPFAADTLFIPKKRKYFDAVIAMYHDQGLIPVKTLAFRKVVNLTIGLPFIRTSPSHGTALDIAGKNKADATSMEEAIKLAVKLS